MKKLILLIAAVCSTIFVEAQTTQVEKSIFGLQTGVLGVWVHNEARLGHAFALRSELGFDSGIFGGSIYEHTGFVMTPVITLEPRWYYNLDKRAEKGKRTEGNSGNFISLKTSYHPDWFIITNTENINVVPDITIIPTWGIRRNIGQHFNYEAGLGIGFRHYFFSSNTLYNNGDANEIALNLHLRIGYRF